MKFLPRFSVKHLYRVMVLCLTLSLFNEPVKAQDCFQYMDFYTSVYPICSPQWITLTVDIRFPSTTSSGYAYGTVNWYNQETGGQPFASTAASSENWSDVTASQDVFADVGKTVWVSYYDNVAGCESQREPFTFDIEPPPNLSQEYGFVCGTTGKIKINSNPATLITLYKLNQYGNFDYVDQNYTGYFEVANYDRNGTYAVGGGQAGCNNTLYYISMGDVLPLDPPSVSGNFSIVSGNSTTINAASDNFYNFRWYNSANTVVGTSTSFTTPVLTARADYHVEGYYNVGTGCTSNATWVTILVTQPPPPPPVCENEMQVSLKDPLVICSPQWVTLTASMANPSAPGVFSGSIKWYYTETGGQPFEEDLISMSTQDEISTSTTNQVDVNAHPTVWVTYYNSSTQCEAPRLAYTIPIFPLGTWNIQYAHACGNLAKLKLNGSSSDLTYYLYKEASGYVFTLMDYNSTGYFEFSGYDPNGVYSIRAANAAGCTTDMAQIGFDVFDTSPPDVLGNTTIPAGTTTTLTATGNGNFFKWTDGSGNFLTDYYKYTTPVLTDNSYTYTVRAYTEDNVCVSEQTTVTVTVSLPTVTYSPLYNSGNFTKTIDLSRPVGTVSGGAGTSGGAASYNIPIYAPPGTNGLAPGISISYSSQASNGVAGYGWNITGLSSISRTGKDMYHDGVVAPVSLTDQDAFTLSGMRLNPIVGANGADGTVYASETESFSKIISHGGSPNNPDWFEVIQKDGSKMEFGKSSDSKILSDDGSNVVLWQLNRIIDINGNYILFNYDNGYRDNRIDEIVYTGNINTGLLPYNSIKFNYAVRSDVATSYLAGSSFNVKHLLNSIDVTSESKQVKNYQFNYGFDNLYSLLKEVVETGSNGVALNSTIFLYSAQEQSLEVQKSATMYGQLDCYAGDFNADGKTDLLTAELEYDQGIKFHKNYQIITGFYDQFSEVMYVNDLPENQRVSGLENKVANFLASDYDGDGRDDVMQVNTIPEAIPVNPSHPKNFINNIVINYSRTPDPVTGNPGYESATFSWKIGPDYRIIEPTTGNFFVNGDFDGDGNQDIITILGRASGNVNYDPSENRYRAFFLSPSTGIVNYNIANLGIGSYSPIEDISTTIADAKVIAVDVDGDGKQEIMATNVYGSYIFSINKTGSGSTATFSASLLFSTAGIVKTSLVYPGDINGDGKTDLLVRNGGWKIMYSTGAGFVSKNFTFNQSVNITNSYSDDKIVVSDFNGDGKCDILHGYIATSTTSKFSLYYSGGNIDNSFLYEQYEYAGTLAFDGTGFTVGDFNGDGKSDLMNRISTSSGADFIYFKPLEKERLLTKVADGHGTTYEFKYKRLTDESVPSFYERTVSLDDAANRNPYYYMRMPAYAVSDFITPNGLKDGTEITSYNYKDAVIHRGKGFLGFKTIISQNNTTGITTTTENKINTDFAVAYTAREVSVLTATGQQISEKVNSVSFINLSTGATDPKRFLQQLDKDIKIDHLTESATETDNTFDSYGNITTAFVKTGTPVYNWSDPMLTTVTPVESVTTTATYGTFNTPVPARPVDVTVDKLRPGMLDAIEVTEYTYTTNGLPSTQTDFFGQPKAATSTFTYDQFGNLATAMVSTAGLNSRLSTITYDVKGRLPVSKQQSGAGVTQTETFDYDFKWGKVVTHTTPDYLTSTFEYDGFGRLNKTNLPAGISVNASMIWDITDKSVYYTFTDYPGGAPDVKIWYDKLGRETEKQVAGFNNQWLTTLTTYDARGNVETKTDPYYATETAFTTTFVYDDVNRLESASNPKGQVNYSYAVLGGGQLELTVSAAGQQTTKITDATNKVISATDKGGQLEYSYDSWGNQTEVKLGGDIVLTNVYDSYGRQTSAIDRNSGTMTYEYDAFSQLSQQTDNNNNTYTMLYDDLGRVISRQGPEGTTLYEYYKDPATGGSNNSLAKVSGINGVVKVYEYDNLKRLQKETTTINTKQFLTQYDHDTYGQITKITYPSGVVVNKTYDNSGDLLTVTGGDNGAPTTLFTAISMNGYDQYTAYTLGNNQSTQNSYTYGYPTRYYTPGIQDLNFNFDYTKSNLQSRRDAIKNLTETFGYDDQNRLTSTTVNNVPQLTMGFDNNSGVSMGNITSKTDAGDYKYSDTKKNQVAYITNPAGPTLNPVTISTNDQVILYTAFQKTASITEGNNELDYVYGADYQRAMSIRKQNNANMETKYYLDDYEMQTDNNGTREIHYVNGGNGLCAIIIRENGANNFNFVYTDYLGSVLTVTDINGNVTAEQNFDAWGRYRNPVDWQYYATSTTAPNVPVWLYRGYTGHEQLPKFALINMNGRMYDPLQGRMLSSDSYVASVFATQSYNRYSYALNNPLSFVDPDGNNPALIIAAIIGAYLGGMMANNEVNPIKWDYQSTKTWTWMIGGAAISAGAAYAGAEVTGAMILAKSPAIVANIAGALTTSFVSSAAFNVFTNGVSPMSMSFMVGSVDLQSGGLSLGYGPVDYNFGSGRFEYLGKKGNTPAENISLGLNTAVTILAHEKALFLTDANKTFIGKVWQVASRFTWELPNTLVGMMSSDLFSLSTTGTVEHKGTTFVKSKLMGPDGGMTIGSTGALDQSGRNMKHEFGHTIQSRILGPLYLPIIGIPSVFRASFDFLWPINTYYNFYTEAWSNKLSKKYY